MDTTIAPQPSTSAEPANAAERKLWLDYLRSLNDRRLQSARNSGLTNYALLALLGGLIYWALPRLPKLFANPDVPPATLVIIALLGDAVSYLLFAYVMLIYYCKGKVEHRVRPEVTRRVANVQMWTFLSLLAAFSLFQLWVGAYFKFNRAFVRWSILALGIWWLLNVLMGLWKRIQMVRKAQKHKVLAPGFTAGSIDPNVGALLFIVVLGIVAMFSSIVLVIYLRSVDWITPLSIAGTILLACAVLIVLFQRGINSASYADYEILERDILLNQLDADAIRSRFVRDTLGPDVAVWLDGLLANLKSEDDELQVLSSTARQQLDEVIRIDEQYAAERFTRAKKTIEMIEKGIQKRQTAAEALAFQARLFIETHKTKREHEILRRWLDDLKARTDEGKKVILLCTQLLAELRRIVAEAEKMSSRMR